MTLKTIGIAIVGALVVVGSLIGGAIAFLVFGPSSPTSPATRGDIECAEEQFEGLCGVRKFFRGERAGFIGKSALD